MEKLLTASTKQLPLALPRIPPRYDRDSFVVSEANEAAWRTATAWAASSEPALVVCGPEGAGKTHLAHLAVEGLRAAFIDPVTFLSGERPGPFLVVGGMPADDPRAFLSALESAAEAGVRAVFTGAGRPSEWALGLKDLRTRLEAAPRAVLQEPDEALIRAVIAKGFRDRQVRVEDGVVEFAAQRLPRTFAAAHGFVALADRVALEERRKITAPFVQKLLANLS